jgi:hypothetical protein
MNKYLKYFPVPEGRDEVEVLSDDELVEILDRAKPLGYQQELLKANYDPYSKDFHEYGRYLENLEASVRIDRALAKGKTNNNNENNNRSDKKDGKNSKGKRGKRGKRSTAAADDDDAPVCSYCKKIGHVAKDCWSDPKNASKRPKGYKSGGRKETNNSISLTTEQFNHLVAQLPSSKKARSTKRRRVVYDSDEEDSMEEEAHYLKQLRKDVALNNSDDEVNNYSTSISTSTSADPSCYSLRNKAKKRSKHQHSSTEVVGEVVDGFGKMCSIRVLLDSGTTSSIVLRQFAPRLLRSRVPLQHGKPWAVVLKLLSKPRSS